VTTATVDLRREAAAEVARLANARAFLRGGDQQALTLLEGSSTWIAIAKRAAVRRALRGRVCLIWRAAFEDPAGRLVASRLVPMLVEMTRSGERPSPSEIVRVLTASETLMRARVEAATEAWRTDVLATIQTFTAARLSRERTINRAVASPAGDPQPGLFDRRGVRAREAHAAFVAESQRASEARVRAIYAAADVVSQPPRLILVLVP